MLSVLVLLLVTVACADVSKLKISSMSETKLYNLYGQIQSQKLLNGLKDLSQYQLVTDYDSFERNPDTHTDEKIYFKGTIVQVTEGSGNWVNLRIAQNGDSDCIFMLEYIRPETAEHLLEDDEVEVYGTFTKLYTYKSTTNLSVTVPYCTADAVIRPITNTIIANLTEDEISEALAAIDERLEKAVKTDKEGNRTISKTNFDDYARNDSHHKDEKITFSGKVVQSTEYDSYTIYRIAVDNDNSRIFYATQISGTEEYRVLEDDTVTVCGTYTGLHTYESTMGGDITIPACSVSSLSLKGYTVPKSFPTDKEGNIKLTKKLFEDYSRRPGVHKGEKITFSAQVLQVIEGSSSASYRMAVDNDSDYVIYVTITKENRSVRLLEDDKVTVVGSFDGLMSYESTMGVKITIPDCTASSIELSGKSAASRPQKKNGVYSVSKKNYESFARDEDSFMDEKVSFTAKVVQVVEDTDEILYRLAVDKDYDCIFLATLDTDLQDVRMLEDDVVKISGSYTGLYSYNSTRGGKITIPSCSIQEYSIDGYKKVDVSKQGSNGYYSMTKKNYSEYARSPKAYIDRKITLKGKVIQVVEGSSYNIYRIAVDKSYDCIVYVTYKLSSGSSRILEDDIVTVEGSYDGLYTYTTTLGSSVTIPAITASDIRD